MEMKEKLKELSIADYESRIAKIDANLKKLNKRKIFYTNRLKNLAMG